LAASYIHPMHEGPRDDEGGDFDAMADELAGRLSDADWSSWSEAELERRAMAAFAHQFASCAPYRAFCEARGVTPVTVAAWQDVPAVPATAFKFFDFVSAGPAGGSSGALFRTSGTTRGPERRGRHHVTRLDLYRASLLEPFRRALLPELPPGASDRPAGPPAPAESQTTARRGQPRGGQAGDGQPKGGEPKRRALFVSLIPSPDDAPDSSLSFMVGAAAEVLASEVHWLVDRSGRWRAGARAPLTRALEEARQAGAPILVLGTALAFAHVVDGEDEALGDLPETARAMETGGFKGARRSVSREELYAGIEAATGIPRGRIVNEYGMTELLSQLYEPVLARGPEAVGLHVAPPWLRVRALDPTSLEPVAEGEDGILAFFDLANLGSVCHVLTEDVGALEGGRLRLRGRAAGAEPRGCSRAMDELLSAAAEGASRG